MSRSESANVLSGVAFILRTSSGPVFPADHTAIDTAHPKVVDWNNQASVGRMTLFAGPLCSARPTNGSYRRNLALRHGIGEGRQSNLEQSLVCKRQRGRDNSKAHLHPE